ncbi:2OG-Fe(II) oxygenase [Sphingomonas koreensis]|nr:2OG-Fe(II) oxygenase [Sphingomonas koreensis]
MLFFKNKPQSAIAQRKRIGEAVAARLDANPAITRAAIETAQLYFQDDYLDAAQCQSLIDVIDTNRRPSTLLSSSPDANFRTSESCDMDRWAPHIRPIDESIARLLGLDPEHGETMQGQRYAPGQQFRAHHDYFHESEDYWQRVRHEGGQRTWTAMIYLNNVDEGGATWFPQAGVRFKPRRGLLLAWNNMAPDGTANPATLHEGMPVVKGVKYIVTKWFREGHWIR